MLITAIRYRTCSKLVKNNSISNINYFIMNRKIHYDGWYHTPNTKPIIQDTTAVILGNLYLP